MITLPTEVTLTGDEAREIVDFMEGVKGYLTTAWCGLEEVAAEANAGFRMLREAHGLEAPDGEVYDEIEDIRRKAAQAIRFAVDSAEHVRKLLDARAYGHGKFATYEPKAEAAE